MTSPLWMWASWGCGTQQHAGNSSSPREAERDAATPRKVAAERDVLVLLTGH